MMLILNRAQQGNKSAIVCSLDSTGVHYYNWPLIEELAAKADNNDRAVFMAKMLQPFNPTKVGDKCRSLETELAAANKRADAAESDAAMFKDAYYGSVPSGATLRCRKCGDVTEISFTTSKECEITTERARDGK